MPDRIDLAIVTQELKCNPAAIKRLADALSAVPQFTPTGWAAIDGRPLKPFVQSVFIKQLGATESDEMTPVIARNKKVKYEGFFGLRNTGTTSLRLTFGSENAEDAVRGIFELGDRLAEQLRAEFGVVHPVWDVGEKDAHPRYGGSARFKAEEYARYGPKAVCARTYVGAHLTELIGKAQLTELGALDTAWGGMQFDLVESPWTSDRAILAARQAVVMAALKGTGVFGDYTRFPFYTKGARWS